jgi:Putative adhesin
VHLTHARRVIIAICVPVAIAAIGWGALNAVAAADTGHYPFSIPLTVSGGKLTADFPGSNVTVVPGDAARLAGTVSYSLVRPQLTVHDGKVSYPCAVPAGECGMTATLTVPPSAAMVNVSTGGGALTVPGGLTGKVTLTTSGSNITANGLAGTANLDSGSGAINASGITASDVTANSYGGNVALTFTKTPRDVQVASASGAVSIVLPHGSYDFRVSAGGGDVRTPASDPAAPDVITVSSAGGNVTVSDS